VDSLGEAKQVPSFSLEGAFDRPPWSIAKSPGGFVGRQHWKKDPYGSAVTFLISDALGAVDVLSLDIRKVEADHPSP
jgi:hypothetical protein